MKYGQIIPFALAATLLTGCGQVMESTANLIDTAAEKIENSNEPSEQEPSTVAQTVDDMDEKLPDVVEETKVVETEEVEVQVKQQVVEQKSDGVVEQKPHSKISHIVIYQEDGNIRSEPSINAAVILTTNHSDKFVYLKENVHTSDGRTWYKVQTSAGVGYISSAISDFYYDDWKPLYDLAVYVNNKEGNVRSEPSIDANVIYTGKYGEELTFTGDEVPTADGRLWYGVDIEGKQGYISDKVSVTNNIGYVLPYQFVITADQGNIRAKADLNSNVIHTGEKDDVFPYTGGIQNTSDGRTWYEVEVNGTYGYISGAVGETSR